MVLHWLAMSHSCYNPVIYCWMNASFRTGFITAISRLSGMHRIVRHETQRNNNASLVGIPLNGADGSGYSGLRRINTCTTYISVPRQKNGSHNAPVRSVSSQHDRYKPQHVQRPQEHAEEQL